MTKLTSTLQAAFDPATTREVQCARLLLVDAGRRLAERGVVTGASGNMSARVGDYAVISARGARLDTLDAAECAVITLASGEVVGAIEPSSETPMHRAIYNATTAQAILHTHSRTATALSTVVTEIPAIHYAIGRLGGPIRVARYATFGSKELASHVLDALLDRTGALMANHGTVCYGSTMDEALSRAETLEWLADVYYRALLVGKPRILTAGQLAEVAACAAALAAWQPGSAR